MGSGQSQPVIDASSSSSPVENATVRSDASSVVANAATSTASADSSNATSSAGGCPMKNADGSYRTIHGFSSLFGRPAGHPPVTESKTPDQDSSKETIIVTNAQSSGGCPIKHQDDKQRGLNIFSRYGPGPGSSNLDSDNNNPKSAQQYDVYSRPIPIDPTNNMPIANPTNLARNSLPASYQSTQLPTERVSSTIPKGGTEGGTWTYPSPQMFWNALARKGKLGDTKEEDMETVVAIHNAMNEGTWTKVLEWEEVIGEGQPKLSRFMGRPTDLSPKAFFKHYFLSHPLPFDRHDWTILRPSGEEVRYVIDYYHDVDAENDSTTIEDLQIGRGGKVNSLLVDVRPALDGFSEAWGRMVSMPLAIRGCESIVDCVLGGGEGNGAKSEFEPLPLIPSKTLKNSVAESKEVWENIQKSVKSSDGSDACDSSSMEVTITSSEAAKIAGSFSTILKQCQDVKADLKNCNSDEDCRKAFMGMTVCAGKVMCPLQHKSFLDTLDTVHGSDGLDEMADAKINTAFEILGECVANYDKKASVAKKQHPDVFATIIGK
ncbi:hypothetical protein ACHAW6_005664 [Cyclotella cf. meneghiniana]